MKYLTTLLLGLACFVVALTAPFAVPIALLFTRREADKLAWSWYDTPDEPDFIGLYEPTVERLYLNFGWFIAAWYWFGFRNRAHGFDSLWSKEAPSHWPDTGSHERDGFFFIRKAWGYLQFSFGWQVYRSFHYDTGLEYRPQLALKFRRPALTTVKEVQ